MAITAIRIALGQHANQDIVYLTIQNVEETVGVIRLGSVLITAVDVKLISLFQMDCVRIVLMVVVYVLDWAVISVRTVLIEHGRYNQH
jgi:hypothetical protein